MKPELLNIKKVSLCRQGYEKVRDINVFMRRGECCLLIGPQNMGRKNLARFFCCQSHGKKEQIFLTAGKICFEGKEITEFRQEELERRGIFYIDPNVAFLRSLTVSENFFLLRRGRMRRLFLNKKIFRVQTAVLMEQYGMEYSPEQKCENLTQCDRILIGMIRAADQGAKLMVLDEVTNGLTPLEMGRIIELVRKMKTEGIGFLVSDNWGQVFEEVSDTNIFIRDGEIVEKQFQTGRMPRGKKGGEPLQKVCPVLPPEKSEAYLFRYQNGTFSFSVCEKEILLIKTEDGQKLRSLKDQLMCKFGENSGEFWMEGKKIEYSCVKDLMDHRIAFWEYSGETTDLVYQMTVWDNVFLPSFRRISRNGFCRKGQEFVMNEEDFFEDRLPDVHMDDLSLRDKHRIMMNRWKLFHPRVLVLYDVLSSSDEQERKELEQYLQLLVSGGAAVVLLETAAEYCEKSAHRVVCMEKESGVSI